MLVRSNIIIFIAAVVLLYLIFGLAVHPSEWTSDILSGFRKGPPTGSDTALDSHTTTTITNEASPQSSHQAAQEEEGGNDGELVFNEEEDVSGSELSSNHSESNEAAIAIAHSSAPSGNAWDANAYIQLKSSKLSTDKKWFKIIFGEQGTYNPNIIPHPWKENTWYMIAQASQWPGETKAALYSRENICEATFKDGHMQCIRPQLSLPIASTLSENCHEDRAWFTRMIGPTDARVLYGPDAPYIMYGSMSGYTCYGLYLHDLRRLAQWDSFVEPQDPFFWPTELRRPAPFGPVEKNWFAFWSDDGEMYLHHDMMPRVLSRVSKDGKSVSTNLAPKEDEACLRQYLPKLTSEEESIHQATNSLAVTMCKRQDPDCVKTSRNTFVFSIFQHKDPHAHHIYQAYVMMFNQTAPFHVSGISSKPLWVNGREKPGDPHPGRLDDDGEMFYITSISWKEQNMTYHGYLDDDLFINFGIDDTIAGTIDVVAGDLLRDITKCS